MSKNSKTTQELRQLNLFHDWKKRRFLTHYNESKGIIFNDCRLEQIYMELLEKYPNEIKEQYKHAVMIKN